MFCEKFESTGNDVLCATMSDVDDSTFSATPDALGEMARKVCNRHFGIGADHLIFLGEARVDRDGFGPYASNPDAHCRMFFFNSDGSSAEMSGNGIRCFALFAQSLGYGDKEPSGAHRICVETLAGIKTIILNTSDDETITGVVNMGRVLFDPADIPVDTDDTMNVVGELLGKTRAGYAANSGIPHWVIPLDSIEELDSHELEHQGLMLRFDDRFVNNTNVSVIVVDSPNHVIARVFERGAHETLSCGTGATAIAAVLHKAGLADSSVTVSLRGGQLTASQQSDDSWMLSGPVRKIARCELAF